MVAALSIATHERPSVLLEMLYEQPSVFDSLWYAHFPPEQGGNVIDQILG